MELSKCRANVNRFPKEPPYEKIAFGNDSAQPGIPINQHGLLNIAAVAETITGDRREMLKQLEDVSFHLLYSTNSSLASVGTKYDPSACHL